MRSLLSDALDRAGYLVTTTDDATKALTLLLDGANAPTPVDILLTDFNMPSLTGLELVDALKCQGVVLPVFLMSGSPNEALAAEALSVGCAGFIKKPFRVLVLVEQIREALAVQ
jgi:CheY-like chemotaxis protein